MGSQRSAWQKVGAEPAERRWAHAAGGVQDKAGLAQSSSFVNTKMRSALEPFSPSALTRLRDLLRREDEAQRSVRATNCGAGRGGGLSLV